MDRASVVGVKIEGGQPSVLLGGSDWATLSSLVWEDGGNIEEQSGSNGKVEGERKHAWKNKREGEGNFILSSQLWL